MKLRGLGRVYRRGRVWWVQYSFRGQLRRESSKSRKRSDAVKLLRRRQGEMGQGRLVGPDIEKTTFQDLKGMILTDYTVNGRKSLERLNSSLKHLEAFFGESRVLDITTDRVATYINARQESTPGAKPATIRNELAALKRMFTLALQAGKVAIRPHIPSIEVRNTRTGFFEDADFRTVLDHLTEHLKPVAEFAYLTGWRKGEILPLEWRQVDFEAGMVRLEPGTTKNDEGRTFPFIALPELAKVLSDQRDQTSDLERSTGQIIPWVFHNKGKPIRDFRGAWKAACKDSGVPSRLFHDLRRTAVRNLERAGVPRSVAMKLTGHKTESVYRRYAIVSEADMKEGVRKLAALQHSVRPGSRPVVPFQNPAS